MHIFGAADLRKGLLEGEEKDRISMSKRSRRDFEERKLSGTRTSNNGNKKKNAQSVDVRLR
jgi:hypothetical protein